MTDKAITKKQADTPVKSVRPEPELVFVPRVDIRETEREVVLLADMPGVDEQSVDIELERNHLALHGTFLPSMPDGYSLTYQEYDTGSFERAFTLGNTIDRDGIKAVVKDGVLRLTLPKAMEAQPKRITVKAG